MAGTTSVQQCVRAIKTTSGAFDILNVSVYNASTSASAIGYHQDGAAGVGSVNVTNGVAEMATTTINRAFVDDGAGWGTSNYNAAGGPAASNDAPGANSLSDLTAAQIAYVDKANGDLHIAEGSSCVDAGTKLAEVSEDFEGRPRLLGLVDIGAHELKPVWRNRHVNRLNTLLRM